MARPDLQDPDYLGDGVYVGRDGYHIWLHLQPANPRPASEGIALEPNVLDALDRYRERERIANKSPTH